MEQDYSRFRDLLNAQFQFPTVYLHKFIGHNNDSFREAVLQFETKFIGLSRTGEKLSATGKHVSFTYDYHAANADDVIQLTVETKNIPGVLYIL